MFYFFMSVLLAVFLNKFRNYWNGRKGLNTCNNKLQVTSAEEQNLKRTEKKIAILRASSKPEGKKNREINNREEISYTNDEYGKLEKETHFETQKGTVNKEIKSSNKKYIDAIINEEIQVFSDTTNINKKEELEINEKETLIQYDKLEADANKTKVDKERYETNDANNYKNDESSYRKNIELFDKCNSNESADFKISPRCLKIIQDINRINNITQYVDIFERSDDSTKKEPDDNEVGKSDSKHFNKSELTELNSEESNESKLVESRSLKLKELNSEQCQGVKLIAPEHSSQLQSAETSKDEISEHSSQLQSAEPSNYQISDVYSKYSKPEVNFSRAEIGKISVANKVNSGVPLEKNILINNYMNELNQNGSASLNKVKELKNSRNKSNGFSAEGGHIEKMESVRHIEKSKEILTDSNIHITSEISNDTDKRSVDLINLNRGEQRYEGGLDSSNVASPNQESETTDEQKFILEKSNTLVNSLNNEISQDVIIVNEDIEVSNLNLDGIGHFKNSNVFDENNIKCNELSTEVNSFNNKTYSVLCWDNDGSKGVDQLTKATDNIIKNNNNNNNNNNEMIIEEGIPINNLSKESYDEHLKSEDLVKISNELNDKSSKKGNRGYIDIPLNYHQSNDHGNKISRLPEKENHEVSSGDGNKSGLIYVSQTSCTQFVYPNFKSAMKSNIVNKNTQIMDHLCYEIPSPSENKLSFFSGFEIGSNAINAIQNKDEYFGYTDKIDNNVNNYSRNLNDSIEKEVHQLSKYETISKVNNGSEINGSIISKKAETKIEPPKKKIPIGGIRLFDGDELLNKIKKRKMLIDCENEKDDVSIENDQSKDQEYKNMITVKDCNAEKESNHSSHSLLISPKFEAKQENPSVTNDKISQHTEELQLPNSEAQIKSNKSNLAKASLLLNNGNKAEKENDRKDESITTNKLVDKNFDGMKEDDFLSFQPIINNTEKLTHINKTRPKGPLKKNPLCKIIRQED